MSNKTLKLLVILGSDRPGRVGERVGKWVAHSLEAYPQFTVDFADLAQLDLGHSLSSHHPRTGMYEGGVRELASKLGRLMHLSSLPLNTTMDIRRFLNTRSILSIQNG